MTDHLTLIEKIQQNQTETATDLELLKQKEDDLYRPDIEAIQQKQTEFAAEIEVLQNKLQQGKSEAQKPATIGTIHALRTLQNSKQKIWIFFDKTSKVQGKARESYETVLSRWTEQFGKPEKIIKYQGICHPSEAAMTIVEIQRENDDAA